MSCNAGTRNIRRQSAQKGYANRVESHVISNAYKKNRRLSTIRVSPAAGDPRRGWLIADGQAVPVALGRGGIKASKREGDGGTPKGTSRPRQLWWRADRHPRPRTFLAVRAIGPEDAWCEDPSSRHYNQPVRRGNTQGGGRLVRDGHLYDLVVEIDHNASPRIKGRGSAVFLHLARDNFGPTAGCVSMTKAAMLRLLQRLVPETET